LQAWDFFHLGLKNFYKFGSKDNREAQRLFRQAVALDPNLAQAHAFLAYGIVLDMLYFDVKPDDRLLNEAEGLAKEGGAP